MANNSTIQLNKENFLKGAINRILQSIARISPGAMTLRVKLHKFRGVHFGKDVWIGYDSILETSHPHLISIGSRVILSVRTTIIAHFHGSVGVRIDDDVWIGPGVIILPNIKIGRGSVIGAGSVVTKSIPPNTFAQGNPAKPVAKCKIPLGMKTPMKTFLLNIRPLKKHIQSNPHQ
jgi:acetyltransferase-like isoleucine patch superfamily enzyme